VTAAEIRTGARVAVVNAGYVLAVAEVLAREPERGVPRRVLLAMPHRQVWWVREPGGWRADVGDRIRISLYELQPIG